jgi:hypothetical protein
MACSNHRLGARRLGMLAAHMASPPAAALAATSGRQQQQQQQQQQQLGEAALPAVLPITDVKVYTVGTRLDGEQLMLGNGRALIIVKVEAAGGLYGWGECGVLGRELAVKGAVEHFRSFLIGSDAMRSALLCSPAPGLLLTIPRLIGTDWVGCSRCALAGDVSLRLL